jgi:hypothetical protein
MASSVLTGDLSTVGSCSSRFSVVEVSAVTGGGGCCSSSRPLTAEPLGGDTSPCRLTSWLTSVKSRNAIAPHATISDANRRRLRDAKC